MTTPRAAHLLRQARGTARVWTEFMHAHTKDPACLYCFFEGRDDPHYYRPRIEALVFQYREVTYHHFWCEGKQSVIEVFHLLTNHASYQQAWVAFFLDRDFDAREELPDDTRVFITPCYAVENLYVGQQVIETILSDEFALADTDPDFEQTITLFHTLLEQFNDASDELNAWLYLQRQWEKRTGAASTIHMHDLHDHRLFNVTLQEVNKKYTLTTIMNVFPAAPALDQAELDQQITMFRNCDRTRNFRGKHLLFFVHTFLRDLSEDRRRKKNRVHFTHRGPVSLRLSHNVLSELSQYADTPACLRDFLLHCANARPTQQELGI